MNNLKKIILVGVLLTVTISFGQGKPDREKIKSLKIAFITERLDLSSAEAEKFWPVYNAHEEKLEEFRSIERTEIRGKLRNLDAVSDSEASKLLDQYIALQEEKNKEQRSFSIKMRKIISAKKTILLMKSEEDFKRRLIKQYRKRNGGGMR